MTSQDESQARPINFACGGVKFSLTLGDDGRWDHNRHAEKVLNSFSGEGPKCQIEVVEALCELMSDGLVSPRRGAATAKGCYKLTQRESCRTIYGHDKDLMFLALSAKQRPEEGTSPSLLFWGYKVDGRDGKLTESERKGGSWPLPDTSTDAAWLRKAMSLCDIVDEGRAAGDYFFDVPERLVARFAANTTRAWVSDPLLWSDYLDWALPRKAIRLQAILALSAAMFGSSPLREEAIQCRALTTADIPTDMRHPAAVIFNKLREFRGSDLAVRDTYTGLLNRAARHSDNVGLLVAAAARRENVLDAVFGHAKVVLGYSEPPHDVNSRGLKSYAFPLEEVAEICGNHAEIPFAYEAATILWKTAFYRILAASLAADSLILAPGVSAGTLDDFLLESFSTGPPEWAPLCSGLAALIVDGVHQRMSGKVTINGHIASIAANDVGRLSEYLLQRRVLARGRKARQSS